MNTYPLIVASGLGSGSEVLILRSAGAPWAAVVALSLAPMALIALKLILDSNRDKQAIAGGAKLVKAWAVVQKYRQSGRRKGRARSRHTRLSQTDDGPIIMPPRLPVE